MDDIAAEAGTSKTVIYRHFDDKAGLYRAVAARIDSRVVGNVGAALGPARARRPPDTRELVASTVEAYLALVESDTEVYRFVVNRPLVDLPLADDPVGGTVDQVTDQLTGLLLESLASPDRSRPEPAPGPSPSSARSAPSPTTGSPLPRPSGPPGPRSSRR